ncbi:hypothetical protein BH11PLA1_BH11PLA1_23570 [soil metagenome]
MPWIAFVIMLVILPAGTLLALLTLPGVWLMLAAAGLVQWWSWAQGAPTPLIFSPAVLYICLGLALLGEFIEFAASAIGTKTAGGSRPAGLGAIFGAILGAVGGTPFLPPIGTILGSALGAGAGALLLEKGYTGSPWRKSGRVAVGAAVGRIVATIVKVSITLAVGMILVIAAFVAAVASSS